MIEPYEHARSFENLPCYRSETVLMPSTRLVYHLTDEDRKKTVRRAAADEGLMAVRYTPDGGEAASVATLGRIDRLERSSTTRMTVVLTGLGRLRIRGTSTTDHGVEVLEAEMLEETGADSPGADALVGDARATLARMSDRGYDVVDDLDASLDRADTHNAIPDTLGAVVFDDPAEHQSMLEEPDVVTRLERVESRLNELLERADALSTQ